MKTTFLEFEQPIAELEAKIEELRYVQDDSAVDISDEIQRMQKKSQALTKEIYAKLTPWQVAQAGGGAARCGARRPAATRPAAGRPAAGR